VKNKCNFWITLSLLAFSLLTATVSCKKEEIPIISTAVIRDITDITAVCGGSLSSDGGSEITKCGVCWSKDSTSWYYGRSNINYYINIIKMNGSFNFTCSITNLTPETKYFVKAYASNNIGTGYGQTFSFTTVSPFLSQINFNQNTDYGNLTDQDGNNYKTVTIGNQVWMAENLKSITFNDMESISWNFGYCWYNNDVTTYKATYGALYNWSSVYSGKLCPVGWHLPTIVEWSTLDTYLGGQNVSGGKLKESGIAHWLVPNEGATNESGFTALPGGQRSNRYSYINNPYFSSMDSSGFWWASNRITVRQMGHEVVSHGFSILRWDDKSFYRGIDFEDYGLGYFLSVRCIKN
jgi:uncharacterized protein (TIGR02145 family)